MAFRFASLVGLVLALTFVLHLWTALGFSRPTARVAGGQETPVSLPYSTKVPYGQSLEVAFTVHPGPLTVRSVVIVPDDHLESISVDGRSVPLDGVSHAERDDYRRGFTFPLGTYLHSGDNRVVVRVKNSLGPGGLDVRSDPRDGRHRAEYAAGLLAFLVLLAIALRQFAVPWSIALLFVAGTAARFGYLSVTPSSLRAHDVGGHLNYIDYVTKHWSLPNPYDGWSFYQPPLYYALAASLWQSLWILGVRTRETLLCALQLQSMLFELGFLGFSLLTAALWLRRMPDNAFGRGPWSRPGLFMLFGALACFWPSSIIHSVRVGNDDLLYLLFGAGFYFASRWWTTGSERDLLAASVCGALGIVTKTNALILFVLLGVLVVAKYVKDPARRLSAHLRRVWPTAALFLLSTGIALGRAAIDTANGKRSNLLVGNANKLRTDLTVGNRAENYLWFDAKIFVTQPFANSLDDAGGRQFFWNTTLKTGLFGEFSFEHPLLSDLAIVLAILLLVLVVCAVLGLLLTRKDDAWDELPALVATAALATSLAALRMSIPMACSEDFRYILPVLTPALWLYVRSLALFRERGWTRLAWAGQLAGWSFVAASALFFGVLTELTP